jgi:hypothetical protein
VKQFVQAGLNEWGTGLPELLDEPAIDVHPRHSVTDGGQAGAGHGTNMAAANDRDPNRRSLAIHLSPQPTPVSAAAL